MSQKSIDRANAKFGEGNWQTVSVETDADWDLCGGRPEQNVSTLPLPPSQDLTSEEGNERQLGSSALFGFENWSFAIQDDYNKEIYFLIHESGNPANCITMPVTLERLIRIRTACDSVIKRLSDVYVEQN